MNRDEVFQESLALADSSSIVMLGSNGGDGFPHIKAMCKAENEGLKTVWFSTNTSSRRVSQLRGNNKACIYFVDWEHWKGLMLAGTIEVLQDKASRERLWKDGDEKYYPQGVDDPDYTVLRFTAQWGNFYHALTNVTFEI